MAEQTPYDIANYMAKEQSIHLEGNPIKEKIDLNIEKLPRELVSIAEQVARISGTWNPVEIYTADEKSRNEEREKVFAAFDKGEEYNPTLTYGYTESLDITAARKQLIEQMHRLRKYGERKKLLFFRNHKLPGRQTLDRGSRLFRTALYYKIKDDLATCDLVDGIKNKDEDLIQKALKQKYPGTDQSEINKTTEEYERLAREGESDSEDSEATGNGLLTKEQVEWLKNKKFTPAETVLAFRWALDQLGIRRTASNGRGFFVKESSQATGIDVRSKSSDGPTVYVPTDRSIPMSAYKLLPLIMHEIMGHAAQEVNGEELFMLGGGRLKVDNEQLYEGKGLREEVDSKKKLYGIDDGAPKPYYPLAIKMAEEGASFFQIFKDQIEKRTRIHLKCPVDQASPDFKSLPSDKQMEIKKQAWLTTLRVMRGHIDMSNKKKFAMAKDLSYLRGYMMDKQLVDNDLGMINEEGVIASGGLAMLAELDINKDDIPIKHQELDVKYFNEVLLPQMPEAIKTERLPLSKAA